MFYWEIKMRKNKKNTHTHPQKDLSEVYSDRCAKAFLSPTPVFLTSAPLLFYS